MLHMLLFTYSEALNTLRNLLKRVRGLITDTGLYQPFLRKAKAKQRETKTDLHFKHVKPSRSHLVKDYAIINASYFLQCESVSRQSKDSQYPKSLWQGGTVKFPDTILILILWCISESWDNSRNTHRFDRMLLDETIWLSLFSVFFIHNWY